MAVSSSYLAFVLGQLADLPRVTDRRMFGGVGLYADGVFFAVMDDDTLFFKVNDATRPRYEQHRMPPFAPMPGKPPMRGYYQVPVSVLEDAEDLCTWAREAVTVGEVAAAGKPRKNRKNSRR